MKKGWLEPNAKKYRYKKNASQIRRMFYDVYEYEKMRGKLFVKKGNLWSIIKHLGFWECGLAWNYKLTLDKHKTLHIVWQEGKSPPLYKAKVGCYYWHIDTH